MQIPPVPNFKCDPRALPARPARPMAHAAALSLLALAALALPAAAQSPTPASRMKGRPDAPVTIYEMSDFQCPWCARFALETMPALDSEYVRTGRVRLVFVNMPLPMHPNAGPAAELALCAARQDRFWPVHDLLFRHQDRWKDLPEPGSYFLALGDSAGADRDALAACVRTGLTRELVRREAEGAARSGARSTPSFYIEGGILPGAQPIEVFREILDSILTVRRQVR